MGIKGVYGEIGPGTRTALLKLAVQKKEECNRSLRIAIDVSIWSFQIQSGKGGTNADLRTLFYRLLRLLRLSIQPLFVFDGPHKPPFKRNKRTNVSGGSAFNCVAIELFDLFGFPWVTAPGEAEAECALLQKEGIVDAVLSEDVDTLMFGCTLFLRNWSSEGTRTNKAPTHVDVHNARAIKQGKSGLDREGMVLVALMSGGDYIPAGIPNCGIKTACEAARAGFGHDLFNIDRKDNVAMQEWRDRLESELHDNISGFFRTRHKTLQIPERFPDRAVLYYYIHPVVSNAQQVEKYRQEVQWRNPNMPALRSFTARAFEWQGRNGLRHFIRVTAPALLGQRLAQGPIWDSYDDMDVQVEEEAKVVKVICGKRSHATTDNTPELRIAFIPRDIVGLDPEAETQAEQEVPVTYTAIYSGDEEELDEAQNGDKTNAGGLTSPRKKRGPSTYDPFKINKEWIPESFVKLGIPLTVENWEAELRDPKKFASRNARTRSRLLKAGMPKGAIEPYLRIEKPGLQDRSIRVVEATDLDDIPFKRPVITSQPTMYRSLTDQVDAPARGIISKNKQPKPQPPSVQTLPTNSSIAKPQKRGHKIRKNPLDEAALPVAFSEAQGPEKVFEHGAIIILSSPTAEKHKRSPSPPARASKRVSANPQPKASTIKGSKDVGIQDSTIAKDPRISTMNSPSVCAPLSRQQESDAIIVLSDKVVNSRNSFTGSKQHLADSLPSCLSPEFCFPPVVRAPAATMGSSSPLASEVVMTPAPKARMGPPLPDAAMASARMDSTSHHGSMNSKSSAPKARMTTLANLAAADLRSPAPIDKMTIPKPRVVGQSKTPARMAVMRPSLSHTKVNAATQASAARIDPRSVLTEAGLSAPKGRQKMVVRESLEGAWKLVDEHHVGYITPARRFSDVDVLDLTKT